MAHLDQIVFKTMANQWTPVARVQSLNAKKILTLIIDDIPVLFFRNAAGQAHALVDRCPHRKVKLSNGLVTEEGYIQCPFHGWQFDGSGTCRLIPFNDVKKLKTEGIRAGYLPCYEGSEFLWLYTAVTNEDIGAPDIPASIRESGWYGDIVIREWNAHWSRAIQTMLDVAHIPFVHEKTIGFALGRAIGKASEIRLHTEMTSQKRGGFEMKWSLMDEAGDTISDTGWLKFLPPNGITIKVMQKGTKQWFLHIWCVPTAKGKSKQIAIARRNYGRYNPIWRLVDLLNIIILGEDKQNVESAWPSRVPSAEISMPTDISTITFQKYHYRMFLKDRE